MRDLSNKSDIMTEVDEVDRRLLEALREDARVSLAELSRRFGIPRVTLVDRLRRLRERNVIRRFTVEVDPAQIGEAVRAFVLVRFERSGRVTQRSLAREVGRLPGVHEVQIIAGEWDLLLKVRGPSLERIGGLVIDGLRSIPGIAATMTIPCLVTVKED